MAIIPLSKYKKKIMQKQQSKNQVKIPSWIINGKNNPFLKSGIAGKSWHTKLIYNLRKPQLKPVALGYLVALFSHSTIPYHSL